LQELKLMKLNWAERRTVNNPGRIIEQRIKSGIPA
jgi:hypothetical protein